MPLQHIYLHTNTQNVIPNATSISLTNPSLPAFQISVSQTSGASWWWSREDPFHPLQVEPVIWRLHAVVSIPSIPWITRIETVTQKKSGEIIPWLAWNLVWRKSWNFQPMVNASAPYWHALSASTYMALGKNRHFSLLTFPCTFLCSSINSLSRHAEQVGSYVFRTKPWPAEEDFPSPSPQQSSKWFWCTSWSKSLGYHNQSQVPLICLERWKVNWEMAKRDGKT